MDPNSSFFQKGFNVNYVLALYLGGLGMLVLFVIFFLVITVFVSMDIKKKTRAKLNQMDTRNNFIKNEDIRRSLRLPSSRRYAGKENVAFKREEDRLDFGPSNISETIVTTFMESSLEHDLEKLRRISRLGSSPESGYDARKRTSSETTDNDFQAVLNATSLNEQGLISPPVIVEPEQGRVRGYLPVQTNTNQNWIQHSTAADNKLAEALEKLDSATNYATDYNSSHFIKDQPPTYFKEKVSPNKNQDSSNMGYSQQEQISSDNLLKIHRTESSSKTRRRSAPEKPIEIQNQANLMTFTGNIHDGNIALTNQSNQKNFNNITFQQTNGNMPPSYNSALQNVMMLSRLDQNMHHHHNNQIRPINHGQNINMSKSDIDALRGIYQTNQHSYLSGFQNSQQAYQFFDNDGNSNISVAEKLSPGEELLNQHIGVNRKRSSSLLPTDLLGQVYSVGGRGQANENVRFNPFLQTHQEIDNRANVIGLQPPIQNKLLNTMKMDTKMGHLGMYMGGQMNMNPPNQQALYTAFARNQPHVLGSGRLTPVRNLDLEKINEDPITDLANELKNQLVQKGIGNNDDSKGHGQSYA